MSVNQSEQKHVIIVVYFMSGGIIEYTLFSMSNSI